MLACCVVCRTAPSVRTASCSPSRTRTARAQSGGCPRPTSSRAFPRRAPAASAAASSPGRPVVRRAHGPHSRIVCSLARLCAARRTTEADRPLGPEHGCGLFPAPPSAAAVKWRRVGWGSVAVD
eukprot:scaffold731_cov328-Prasinococcus_capsulatus_cf.AAC.5